MHVIQLIVFLPLLAAIVAGLGNRAIGNVAGQGRDDRRAVRRRALLSWPIFLHYPGRHAERDRRAGAGLDHSRATSTSPGRSASTALTAVMLVVVTTVSALVHLYSWGYMEEDPDQPRFFAYLSLFTFAMLMLVTADNLVQMFFGWEGRGPRLLSADRLLVLQAVAPTPPRSRRSSSTASAISASSLGIFGTFLVFGTVSIPAILAAAPRMAGSTIGFLGHRVDTMTVLCLLLFVGAMGKSAQLGLHTWLPDAMEGPTPVSRADPRRDDGHRGRVHGLPPVADVRDQRRPR